MEIDEILETIHDLKSENHVTNNPYIVDLIIFSNKRDENGAIAYIQNCFQCDKTIAQKVFTIITEEIGEPLSPEQASYNNAMAKELLNKPKCPTCSSTNVKKISVIAKLSGAAAFGYYSKLAASQFECRNCGYMW